MSKERIYEPFGLPSGRTVKIWTNATGRANQNAQRAAKDELESMNFALLAQVVQFEDGKTMPYEQMLDELSMRDILALQKRVFSDSPQGAAVVKKSSPDESSPS